MNSLPVRKTLSAVMVSALALTTGSAYAQQKPAPVSQLVDEVDIPYSEFTLDNGLKVIVNEDHKAPIVAVSVWYSVGSKDEPTGKTGYAHLFEHIMFNGSEHAPNDYFEYTKEIGATDLNGTTWLDRTNYFETVPKAALESALFLESDRMGHLLGALDQEKLDNQIGVVSNEKRQGDNEPYGLVDYRQTELLFPESHPYGHTTIGSLADLKAASLADIKGWFTDHYGPNNAILVLAGDITAAEAKPLVQKWFGDIKRGKPLAPLSVPVPTLDKPITETMTDKVPNTRIYRTWVVPGLADPEFTALDAGASVLGGLASSRLDNILVRKEQSAVSVSAQMQPFKLASLFDIQVNVKPGEDVEAVSKRLDEIMADFIAKGPTQDEVNRVATSSASSTISGLEQVGGFSGKAVALAQGKLFAGDADYYKKELLRLAAITPESVSAAMKKWLTRPALEIRVEPGERKAYEEVSDTPGAAGTPSAPSGAHASPSYYQRPMDPAFSVGAAATGPAGKPMAAADRSGLPPVGNIGALDFPKVETATLSNGIKVYFAKRDAVPVVRATVNFDIGSAADPKGRSGTTGMVVAMLDEGTKTLDSIQFAEAQERLGAGISVGSSLDDTQVSVRAVKPNLAASLDLLADVIKNPAFDAGELERVRKQQLTRIAGENTQPIGIALRNLPPLIYGKDHPYGAPLTGSGEADVVATLTRNELTEFHRKWMRPERAEIFVVGDTSLAEIQPLLETRFGKWKAAGASDAAKNIDQPIPPANGRIIVINKPNSPQSLIFAGQVLGKKGTDDLFALQAANEVMGGDFLSRLNSDLRETKGWSYGVSSFLQRPDGRVPFFIYAPVQTDQTGPSVAALRDDIAQFVGDKGVTAAELERTITGNTRELPGSFELSSAVLGEMMQDVRLNRSFDYATTIPARYAALDAGQLDSAMREAIDVNGFTWLIIGDAAKIKTQVEALGIPVEYQGYTPDDTANAGAPKSEDDSIDEEDSNDVSE